jgi:hypothetical protein
MPSLLTFSARNTSLLGRSAAGMGRTSDINHLKFLPFDATQI